VPEKMALVQKGMCQVCVCGGGGGVDLLLQLLHAAAIPPPFLNKWALAWAEQATVTYLCLLLQCRPATWSASPC
jgi:hypothetical protein